jgi:hypothetical protein
MAQTDSDRLFAGSIPQLYERYLVPLLFQPCAEDLAQRVAACAPGALFNAWDAIAHNDSRTW